MYVRCVAVMEDTARLADMPAGPRLAAALARIDSARVPNNDLLALLVAQSRQAAHEAARLLGVIAEINRAVPTFDDAAVARLDRPVSHAADEVRAALAWSRRAADRECDLAEQLVHDLPQVYAAFLAGEIDRSKVRVFADHLAGLTQEQIATICQVLLPVAARLTPGQLVVRLRRLIAAIDPRHYERRYRKALRDRTVCAWLDENGTAVLHARGLTPAQAQAAIERIDLLAHAARRAGHPSTLDQVRADVLVGLLDGTLHHLTRDQIITHLLTHRAANDDPPTVADPSAPDSSAPDSDAPKSDAPESDAPGAPESDAPESDAPDCHGPAADAGDDQRVGVEIRVALSTLLGHDDHPGEIPGLGPVPASHARAVVARQHRAEWRYAITDDIGRLLFDGVTRRRPTGRTTTGPPGGIVELHMPAALLATLTNSGDGAGPVVARWAGLLADLAPLCRHDHTLKTRAGWILQQPAPGTFLWLTPLGGRYEVQPEPVLPPLPDTCPGPDDPDHDQGAPQSPESLTLHGPDPPSSPAPDIGSVDLDAPPPF